MISIRRKLLQKIKKKFLIFFSEKKLIEFKIRRQIYSAREFFFLNLHAYLKLACNEYILYSVFNKFNKD